MSLENATDDSYSARSDQPEDELTIDTMRRDVRAARERGDIQESHRLLATMLDTATIAGDQHRMASIEEEIGDLYTALGDYPNALSHLLHALALREETADLDGIGSLLGVIGIVHGKSGDLEKAHHFLTESLTAHRESGNAEMEVLTTRNLGEIQYSRGNLDEALDCGLRALAVYEALGDHRNKGATLLTLARVYERQLRIDAAFSALTSAQRELQNVEDYELQGAVLLSLGRLYRKSERYEEARFVLEQGAAIAQEIEDPSTLHECHDELARTLENMGAYREALEHTRRAQAIRDAFAAQETQRTLADMQMRYDMERRVKDEEIRQRNNVVQAIVETQEAERHRIAGELHDGIGQMLAAVKMNLLLVDGGMSELDEKRRRAFATAMTVLDGAVRDVRTIAHSLSSSTLQELGIVAAMQEIVDSTVTSEGVRFTFDAHGVDEHIPEPVELGVYRIAQELITNVLRHAHAETAHISLVNGEEEVILMIEDDGVGFDPTVRSGGGMGRRNMEARVRTMNGRIMFDSIPGHGTTVTVAIPIPSSSEHH